MISNTTGAREATIMVDIMMMTVMIMVKVDTEAAGVTTTTPLPDETTDITTTMMNFDG